MTENNPAQETPLNDSDRQRANPVAAFFCVGLAFAAWAIYCHSRSQPVAEMSKWIDLAIQLACLLVPSFLICFWANRGQNSGENLFQLGFRRNWKIGVAIGAVVAGGYVAFMWYDPMLEPLNVPKQPVVWAKLVLIPIGLELLFRRILATQIIELSQSLDGAQGWDSWIAGLILSSVAFAAFMGIQGYFVSDIDIKSIVTLATNFGFGCAFALLFLVTKSIWSSLLPHWAWAIWSAISS